MSQVRKTDTTISTMTLAASSCNGHTCPASSASPPASVAAHPATSSAARNERIAPAVHVTRAEEHGHAAHRCRHDEDKDDQDLLAKCGEGLRDEREQGQSHRDDVPQEDRLGILTQVRVMLVAQQAQVDRDGDEEEADERTGDGRRGDEELTPLGQLWCHPSPPRAEHSTARRTDVPLDDTSDFGCAAWRPESSAKPSSPAFDRSKCFASASTPRS